MLNEFIEANKISNSKTQELVNKINADPTIRQYKVEIEKLNKKITIRSQEIADKYLG